MIVKKAQAARDLLDRLVSLARVQDHPVGFVQFVQPKAADFPVAQVAEQSRCCQQVRLGKRFQANADLRVSRWNRERVA
jgi:hypothetical protein